IVGAADARSHRGDPPVFCARPGQRWFEGRDCVPPLASPGSGDVEAAVHDPGLRVAEAIAPLPQARHEALRPGDGTLVRTRLRPGPLRWKSWMFEWSRMTNRYTVPAFSSVTLSPC